MPTPCIKTYHMAHAHNHQNGQLQPELMHYLMAQAVLQPLLQFVVVYEVSLTLETTRVQLLGTSTWMSKSRECQPVFTNITSRRSACGACGEDLLLPVMVHNSKLNIVVPN